MKQIVLNNQTTWETCADDVFSRLGLKPCTHEQHSRKKTIEYIDPLTGESSITHETVYPDACGQYKTVSVDERYYKKARQFPSGHLVYINPYD